MNKFICLALIASCLFSTITITTSAQQRKEKKKENKIDLSGTWA
ncbi:MAG TPA: hypothetical protein VGN20_12075 [Mucilaginibacter sp.]